MCIRDRLIHMCCHRNLTERITFKEKEEKMQSYVWVCTFVLELTHTTPLIAVPVNQGSRSLENHEIRNLLHVLTPTPPWEELSRKGSVKGSQWSWKPAHQAAGAGLQKATRGRWLIVCVAASVSLQ